jgi:hypothetical protein
LLVYGAFDTGVDHLITHFGRNGRRLERFENVRATMLDDLDHAIFSHEALAAVLALCESFVHELGHGAPPGLSSESATERPRMMAKTAASDLFAVLPVNEPNCVSRWPRQK